MNAVWPGSSRRFSDDSASDVPARSTNAGAQMCVIQRVRNSPAGSGDPGTQPWALVAVHVVRVPRDAGVIDRHQHHDEPAHPVDGADARRRRRPSGRRHQT